MSGNGNALSPWTVIAKDRESRQSRLLMEVHPDMNESTASSSLDDFKKRMYDNGFRIGLLINQGDVHVVRDLLRSVKFKASDFNSESISIQALLGAPTRTPALRREVMQWLEGMSTSWNNTLSDAACSVMVPEVVGNLAEAEFEELDGMLSVGVGRE